MPRLLRAFILVFMTVPAFMIWFFAVVMAGSGWANLLGERLNLSSLATAIIPTAVAFVAHVIHLLAGHLLDDPRYRFAPGKIGTRLGWDAALHYSGIVTAAAGMGTVVILSQGAWLRGSFALLLFGGFGYAFLRLRREHDRRLQGWTWTRPELPVFPESER